VKDWVRGGRKGRWWHTREGGARQGMRGDRVKYCGLRARDCETGGWLGGEAETDTDGSWRWPGMASGVCGQLTAPSSTLAVLCVCLSNTSPDD